MNEPLEQFKAALSGRGIIPPDNIQSDGVIHRCNAEGKNGKGDASYLLHLDGIPAGGFENFRDGQGWQNWRADIGRGISIEEKADHQKRIEAARQKWEAEQQEQRAKARAQASETWEAAEREFEHPYLSRKGVKAHGARRVKSTGALVIPLRDTAGKLHSLQFINAKGEKRFLKGGRKHGCYFPIGKPDGTLCIAEGFATGASIHEATGYPVAVAFDAGNLLPVAQALRKKYPDAVLIVCADDDHQTAGNPGLTKARETAQAIGGRVAVPDFGDMRQEGQTDFNDLHKAQGLEAVKRCITAATGEEKTIARHNYGNGYFSVSDRGVFFTSKNKDDGEANDRWLCASLSVLAKTRDDQSREWGRLLEWRDEDGAIHRWAMPMELLQGDGVEIRRELSRMGLLIASSKAARDLLAAYLQAWPVKARARCVDRLGWHGAVFVTPSGTIGQDDEAVVFQNAHAIEPAFAVAGTVASWRNSVAKFADGNSRLMFAICVAFAGALAEIAGEDSGGFHFRGASSSGKTTLLKAAASVWGNPSKYTRLWRATANGLEGLAALHNDGLLILDELSQADPKEAGEAAYLLANGQGKARASRMGTARQAALWRVLFLSAGEIGLADLMAQAKRKMNAGQEIRLADIEADTGAGMGAFEALHGFNNPAALAVAVKDAAGKHHGAAGAEWLRLIVQDRQTLPDTITKTIRQFAGEITPADAGGQVSRVARRFALIATAGEMATRYGLTGWAKGAAFANTRTCFNAWLQGFGGSGNAEERGLLAQVKAFFEKHGDTRFQNIEGNRADEDNDAPTYNRAGFRRMNYTNSTWEYLALPEVFRREICEGFNPRTAAQILLKAGWLEPGQGGKHQQQMRITCMGGHVRCYVFNSVLFEAATV